MTEDYLTSLKNIYYTKDLFYVKFQVSKTENALKIRMSDAQKGKCQKMAVFTTSFRFRYILNNVLKKGFLKIQFNRIKTLKKLQFDSFMIN